MGITNVIENLNSQLRDKISYLLRRSKAHYKSSLWLDYRLAIFFIYMSSLSVPKIGKKESLAERVKKAFRGKFYFMKGWFFGALKTAPYVVLYSSQPCFLKIQAGQSSHP